jgi:DnaJ family protein C protein 11
MSETSSRFSRFNRQERESIINGSTNTFEEDLDDIDQEIQPIDYYGIMNVSRSSDDNEIKNAYKRLCLTFHPDKQPEEQKGFAESKFHLIQKAYHVLSDPNKRHIYDLYGEVGLEDSTWDLTLPTSKEALLLEFEHRAKLKREIEEQTRVKSKGEIIIAIDATRLFRGKKRVRRKSRGLAEIFDLKNLPEFQHALVVHSWESRYDDNNTLSLKGNVITKNGLGQGGVTLGLRHIATPTLWGEV